MFSERHLLIIVEAAGKVVIECLVSAARGRVSEDKTGDLRLSFRNFVCKINARRN
jgi:hypothetical protein